MATLIFLGNIWLCFYLVNEVFPYGSWGYYPTWITAVVLGLGSVVWWVGSVGCIVDELK